MAEQENVPAFNADTAYGSDSQKDYEQEFTPHTISSILTTTGKFQAKQTQMMPIQGYGGTDYLFVDEHKQKGERSWNEKLCYNTGMVYASGLASGGLWGALEGARSSQPNAKLKVNHFLNSVTRRGPLVGNQAAVVALIYTSTQHMIESWATEQKVVSHTLAGAASGLLYKSTAGTATALRTSAVFGGLSALGSTAYYYLLSSDS